MAEMERSYLVYALIVIVLLVVIALIALKFYPDIYKEIGKIANEVFGIVSEEEEETLQTAEKFVSSLQSCLSTDLVRCGCKLESRHLPEDYFMIIRNTPQGAVISLLSSEDVVIGEAKLVQGVKVGISLHAYNSRDAFFSERALSTIDNVCLFDRDIRMVGNSENVMSTEIGEDSGIFYGNSDSTYKALPELYKVSEDTVCLVTTDMAQDDIGDREIEIDDVNAVSQKEIVYPVKEITQAGRLRSSGLEAEDIDDFERLTASYLQSADSCSGDGQFDWPVNMQDVLITSCSLDAPATVYSASTYDLELPEDSEIIAQSNSEVSGSCNDCPAGEKWVELKYVKQLLVGRSIFKFRYVGLKEIKPEIISVRNLRVRSGQPIGTSSGKLKVYVTDANGKAVHPGCIFPSLVQQHYSSSCSCPGNPKYASCVMDIPTYFYNCWR